MNMNTQMNADYHSALLLNNLGVSLIERGRHKQAACALKDSLRAMKILFKKRTSNQSMQLARKLKQARMWNEGITLSNGMSSTLTYENNQIALDEHDEMQYGSLHPVSIPVSQYPKSFISTGRDPQLEMSIILNNIGIAFFYVSTTDCTSGASMTFANIQEQALNMMSFASSIIVERFSMCDEIEDETRLMSVALLVTGNTMHICRHSGRLSDARDQSNKFRKLSLAIRRCGVVAPTA